MKKILLIIFLIMAIFQMVVLAADIDIGLEAFDRENGFSTNITMISRDNPANETGTITIVEIWADEEMGGCEVATFFSTNGVILTTRDSEVVDNGNGAGVVLAGSKQTFTVDIDVQAGDMIGLYCSSGKISFDGSGSVGMYYQAGDKIPCETTVFIAEAGYRLSLYGEGELAAEEEANAIFFGTTF